MSPLSFLLAIVSVLFVFFAIDGLQRRKLNAIHFLLFLIWSGLILAMLFIPWFDATFSRVFGVAKGSDIIVYGTLIVLGYFYFEVLHELVRQKSQTTRLISQMAINGVQYFGSGDFIPHTEKDRYIFLMRAYNESLTIGWVIDDIMQAGFSKIVVMSDGSSDGTSHIVHEKWKEYSTQWKHIWYGEHTINRWWWAANKTLFQFITPRITSFGWEWVITYDADDQMDIADMEFFIQRNKTAMQEWGSHAKAFLWSRFVTGGSAADMPRGRAVILRWSKIITRIFNRIDVSDPHNGYRVLHASILPGLKFTSDGMMYASELLDCLRRESIIYEEVPVHIKYTDYSLGKGQQNRNAVKILVELIYKKVFYR